MDGFLRAGHIWQSHWSIQMSHDTSQATALGIFNFLEDPAWIFQIIAHGLIKAVHYFTLRSILFNNFVIDFFGASTTNAMATSLLANISQLLY